MAENEAQCRVTFSEELLQVVHHVKEINFEHLLTDDESWFYYEEPHDSASAPSTATLPTRKMQKIKTKTCMVSVTESLSNSRSLLALPAWMWYGAEPFCASVLPSIERNLCDKRRETLGSVNLYLDNAPVHNAKQSRQELPEHKPPGSCIRLILLMLHSVTSSCLVI
jgi:hypothetical protein